jgi:hypothetical protein
VEISKHINELLLLANHTMELLHRVLLHRELSQLNVDLRACASACVRERVQISVAVESAYRSLRWSRGAATLQSPRPCTTLITARRSRVRCGARQLTSTRTFDGRRVCAATLSSSFSVSGTKLRQRATRESLAARRSAAAFRQTVQRIPVA